MSFNKNLVRLCAFLTAVIIFIVSVIANGFSVFADDGYSLVTALGVNDTVITNEDYNSSLLLAPDSALFTNYRNVVNNNASVPTAYYDSNYHMQNGFDNYVAFVRQDGGVVAFYPLPSGAFIGVFSDNVVIFYGQQISGPINDYNIFPMNFYGSGAFWSNSSEIGGTATISGLPMTLYTPSSSQWKLVSSSVDVKGYDGTYASWDKDYNSLGENFNPNGEIGETANNNLVMSDSDFSFKNDRFVAPYSKLINTGSIYPNGMITFTGVPTEYQKTYPNEFVLTFGFQFRYDVTYQNYGDPFGPFKSTSELLNTKKRFKTQLHYSSSTEYIDVPLSQFINNGNSVSWSMQDILSHMVGEYTYQNILDQSKELDSVSYNAFDIVCNAYISHGSDSSGEHSEWYNPMSEKGYTTSKNMQVNDNPYFGSSDTQGDDDYYGELEAPGTAGNGSSTGSGSSISNASTGEIVINNYNEVNVGDNTSSGGSGSGSGSGAPSNSEEAGLAFNFYNTFNPFSLIFNKMVGDNETISNETLETIGSNSFITFLKESFSFIPSSVWDKLAWYVGACLTILIVAVVLRVILDLL